MSRNRNIIFLIIYHLADKLGIKNYLEEIVYFADSQKQQN